jgi:protein-S-isoprenylcysteine O-methyltransferase Ste14
VPFIIVPLLSASRGMAAHWLSGLALLLAGEGIRLAGVAAALGAASRSRSVDRLVTSGIFAWTRNPLYLGNLLAWLGLVVASGTLWFLPLAAALFVAPHSLIIRHEETVLEAAFDERYDSYRRRTPRWLPRPPRARLAADHCWRAALASERITLLAYAAIAATFALEQAMRR